MNLRTETSRAAAASGRADLKRRYLRAIDIFQDLSEEQIGEIDRSVRMSTVERGRVVFEPEESPDALFVLKQGRIQIYRISPEGRRFVVANIEPGTFFGELALIGQSMHGSFAETLEDSTLCVMSRHDVEALIRRHPQVGVRIMQTLAERLSDAETQLEDLALKSLASRLATLILRLTVDGGDQMLGLTHNDLAERVGTSRETATQALNELKAAGLINIGRKRIEVVDREGLEAIAESY